MSDSKRNYSYFRFFELTRKAYHNLKLVGLGLFSDYCFIKIRLTNDKSKMTQKFHLNFIIHVKAQRTEIVKNKRDEKRLRDKNKREMKSVNFKISFILFLEFPVCEIGDQVEGSDPQNDKKKYPWLNFFIGDTFQLLDSNQLHYIVKDSTNKVGFYSGLDLGVKNTILFLDCR